jgi:hypothetical protein
MATIHLDRSPQRADLRGFVVAVALLWLIVAAVVSVLTGYRWPVGVAALTSAGALVPGLWRPRLCLLPYRIFNRLTTDVSRVMAAAVRWVSFHMVIGGAGLVASRLQQTKPAGINSGWQRRGPIEIRTMWRSPAGKRSRGWVRNYMSWASTLTNLWVWCLLPLLMILSTVEAEEEDGAAPSGNYSLY